MQPLLEPERGLVVAVIQPRLVPSDTDGNLRRVRDLIGQAAHEHGPELILLQCGADSIAGDPIKHLRYTPEAHAYEARRLVALADRHAQGRVLGMGGGGYNRINLAQAWTGVVQGLVDGGAGTGNGEN